MYRHELGVEVLEKERDKQLEGYEYIENSTLEYHEKQPATEKVLLRIKQLEASINALRFIVKTTIFVVE